MALRWPGAGPGAPAVSTTSSIRCRAGRPDNTFYNGSEPVAETAVAAAAAASGRARLRGAGAGYVEVVGVKGEQAVAYRMEGPSGHR